MMADPGYQYPHNMAQRKSMPLQPDRSYPAVVSSAAYTHSRTRTSSSSALPNVVGPQIVYQKADVQNNFTSRRTPSTGTFSTTASSGNGLAPIRTPNTDLRRSASSRSGGIPQPTSYVALMRKQKATVWCDRAQFEDPRLLAAQRAAKIRAANEVLGGSASGRVPTAGSGSLVSSNRVTAKIRHHGKAVGYTAEENFGVGVGGVPMRLSATEVEGGDSDEDADSGGMYHRRTSSGRSSFGSRRGIAYRPSNGSGRWSSGNTPPNEQERVDSLTELAEETPNATAIAHRNDYFAPSGDRNSDGNGSTGSVSSGEKADGLSDLNASRLASNSLLKSTVTREKSTKNPDELRRRGSVDDRTMTLSTGRLYIANPDADSD